MKRLLFVVAATSSLPMASFSFCAPGHEAMAPAAFQMLDSQTKATVNAIVAGQSIADSVISPDRVRESLEFPVLAEVTL